MPSLIKRSRGSLFLVGAVMFYQTLFACAHDRPGLQRQDATRRLLRESSKPWLQEHFPSPHKHSRACGAGSSRRLCDPDGVLSSSGKQNVDAYLGNPKYVELANDCLVSEASETMEDNTEKKQTKIELQMGVALVKKMDLAPFSSLSNEDERKDRASETFSRYVHDNWGVGEETECGGAGILLFLSIEDRTVFVSRGAALENSLTNRRLDSVIGSMKDLLRSREYDSAILQSLEGIRQYIESGPPTIWENFFHFFVHLFFPVVWIAAVLGTVFRSMWVNSRMHRDYARARSQLNEIDRARAEALQGRYQCKSCPICLDDFAPPTAEDGVATTGSDGKPIKLLRCGHCLDETCWAEWVNSGQGVITKCPICMQDTGGADETRNNAQQQQGAPVRRRAANDNNNMLANDNNNIFNHDEDRMIRQYRRERNFRLARLGARYPQIIRPNQIQRWTQPGYDGSLVRDPSFVQSNPSLTSAASDTGGSRVGGGGFGGSSSGGGRGGKW